MRPSGGAAQEAPAVSAGQRHAELIPYPSRQYGKVRLGCAHIHGHPSKHVYHAMLDRRDTTVLDRRDGTTPRPVLL
jgi:hypothetical protein